MSHIDFWRSVDYINAFARCSASLQLFTVHSLHAIPYKIFVQEWWLRGLIPPKLGHVTDGLMSGGC